MTGIAEMGKEVKVKFSRLHVAFVRLLLQIGQIKISYVYVSLGNTFHSVLLSIDSSFEFLGASKDSAFIV